eukprot:gnl/MRDRNA2_/MRDRNA2_82518_c0_seq2.p1 gnl/MRDRNA2_/MRDRNA2_82518_c0~~gnl/MRDRNA2_/MRDRNA2_82518_c0_seq2.p1  ORF type:complete len:128 (+),score=2.66 gnl/MRDRNA2_/MRDRNA2_82518_c0_seq2:226-609(+)
MEQAATDRGTIIYRSSHIAISPDKDSEHCDRTTRFRSTTPQRFGALRPQRFWRKVRSCQTLDFKSLGITGRFDERTVASGQDMALQSCSQLGYGLRIEFLIAVNVRNRFSNRQEVCMKKLLFVRWCA